MERDWDGAEEGLKLRAGGSTVREGAHGMTVEHLSGHEEDERALSHSVGTLPL